MSGPNMPLILLMRCGRPWCDVADDMRAAGVDPGRIEGIGKLGTLPVFRDLLDTERPADFVPGDIPGDRRRWCEAFAVATSANVDDLINLQQWALNP